MKKIFFIIILFLIIFSSINFVSAQGMMRFPSSSPDNATIQNQQQEEQIGKNLLGELSDKTVACSQFTDADFEKIGEYFMGQAIGDTSRHITMNEMMKSMMGDQGEEQMHIFMGKRMSNCEPNAPISQNMMGMMNMMGGLNFQSGMTQGMMGNYGFGYWNLINILYTVLLVGIIILVYFWIIKLRKETKKR